jgi:hypothetical protein
MYSELIIWIVSLFNSVFAFAPPILRIPVASAIVAIVLYIIGNEVSDEERDVFATISMGGKVFYSKLSAFTFFIVKGSIRLFFSGLKHSAKSIVIVGGKLKTKASQLVEIEDALIKIESPIIIKGVEIKFWQATAVVLAITGGSVATLLDLLPFL